jgi:hypothetical protein
LSQKRRTKVSPSHCNNETIHRPHDPMIHGTLYPVTNSTMVCIIILNIIIIIIIMVVQYRSISGRFFVLLPPAMDELYGYRETRGIQHGLDVLQGAAVGAAVGKQDLTKTCATPNMTTRDNRTRT